MAFQGKMRGVPRDPDAMDERSRSLGIVTTLMALVAVIVVAGLVYAFEVGQGPAERSVNPASTTQLTPAPATAPTTQPNTAP